jgi:hypothetical protein
MAPSKPLLILSWLTAVLVALYAGQGLFWMDAGGRQVFTTLHGQTVELYGQGVYRFDTVLIAAGNRGTDAVMLFGVVPLLVFGILLARRGSLAGRLVLLSALLVCLYNAAALTFSAAYNRLVFVYDAAFSLSLFAFILSLTSFDLPGLSQLYQRKVPRRGMAAFLLFAGLVTAGIWLSGMLPAWLRGAVPQALSSYTTIYTYVFDLAVITPVTLLCACLLLRGKPLGLVLAPALLILFAAVGVMVIFQTIFQLQAGIVITAGQLAGLVGSWVILGMTAVGLLARFFYGLEQR